MIEVILDEMHSEIIRYLADYLRGEAQNQVGVTGGVNRAADLLDELANRMAADALTEDLQGSYEPIIDDRPIVHVGPTASELWDFVLGLEAKVDSLANKIE